MLLDQKALERRSLRRNEALFSQGDEVTAIYFIEAGRLRLERRTFDGRSLILGNTPAGEFFVEAALFADTYHCDAIASEPSRVRVYPKAAVLNALRADSAGAMSFLALVARQVIELRQRLEIMKVRSAKERVLLYLDLNAGSDGRTVNLPGQLQDIASELGLTREALYRTLAGLARTGAIERAVRAGQSHMGEQIRIVDGTDRVQKQRDSCLVHAYAIALRLRGRVRVGAHTKIRASPPPPPPLQPKSDISDFGQSLSDRTRVNPSSVASGRGRRPSLPLALTTSHRNVL